MSGVLHSVCAVLLAAAVLLVIACAVGVMVMRDSYQRLQFVSPAGTIGGALFVAAVVMGDGSASAVIKIALIAILLAFQNGVIAHATARAVFVRDRRCWPPPAGELDPVTKEDAP